MVSQSKEPLPERRRAQTGFGIDPNRLYTVNDLRALWGAGKSLAHEMERAGFEWERVKWRKSMRFALGADIIEFIKGKKE